MNDLHWLLPKLDVSAGAVRTADYLESIGIHAIAPATCPFDPGYNPMTWAVHLVRSSHLVATMKISKAGGFDLQRGGHTRWKVAARKRHGVPTVTGGGPFEIAVQHRQLARYLDLVEDIGTTASRPGRLTDMPLAAR